ncbi:hypothetical protein K458DRAFT_424354 [Lentithecium fluviatile CBS 122367]|uniref:Uncharacterized protein n=1 Tax=Lentithecium fluviatile CBS 122367 TaxID=1168545 RepID=A0A6G1IFK2_9PLEO|nr:hypothetical protein K458DRAFT_424354 [Lentithecium fluviatile CBS 122367]
MPALTNTLPPSLPPSSTRTTPLYCAFTPGASTEINCPTPVGQTLNHTPHSAGSPQRPTNPSTTSPSAPRTKPTRDADLSSKPNPKTSCTQPTACPTAPSTPHSSSGQPSSSPRPSSDSNPLRTESTTSVTCALHTYCHSSFRPSTSSTGAPHPQLSPTSNPSVSLRSTTTSPPPLPTSPLRRDSIARHNNRERGRGKQKQKRTHSVDTPFPHGPSILITRPFQTATPQTHSIPTPLCARDPHSVVTLLATAAHCVRCGWPPTAVA